MKSGIVSVTRALALVVGAIGGLGLLPKAVEAAQSGQGVTAALRGHPWGERVALMPHPFSPGELRPAVDKILHKSKYRLDPQHRLSIHRDYALSADSQVFEMTANEGPCLVRYAVAVRFDANDRLSEASGVEDEGGCL